MLLKPPWKRQVELKMAILAPFLAHLGALGRHLGFNLVHLGAKLGAKRHLTGLSQKSFLKVFAGMASRTPPKIIQEAGGFHGKRHCDLSRRWTLHCFLIRLGRCRRGVVGLHLMILRFS